MEIKNTIKELENYCKNYLKSKYKENYIENIRKTKNGLFIYGHKVYAPEYNTIYRIKTYISWYEEGNYKYINELLEYFVLDCKRLNKYEGRK